MEILINNDKVQIVINTQVTGAEINELLGNQLGLLREQYYLVANGKCIQDFNIIQDGRVYILPRVLGGKGGFGSMLRAIGAQIEKTTNREACRDLSGRRLRDINEEQRLKNWINQQAEREKEAKDRKQKKLERLCEKPKHEFKDAEYDKERSALPENVEDAVLQGIQASCSTNRTEKKTVVKKKPKLWLHDELEEELSTSSSDNDEECDKANSKQQATEKISIGIQKDREYMKDGVVRKGDRILEAAALKRPNNSEPNQPEEKKRKMGESEKERRCDRPVKHERRDGHGNYERHTYPATSSPKDMKQH